MLFTGFDITDEAVVVVQMALIVMNWVAVENVDFFVIGWMNEVVLGLVVERRYGRRTSLP